MPVTPSPDSLLDISRRVFPPQSPTTLRGPLIAWPSHVGSDLDSPFTVLSMFNPMNDPFKQGS